MAAAAANHLATPPQQHQQLLLRSPDFHPGIDLSLKTEDGLSGHKDIFNG